MGLENGYPISIDGSLDWVILGRQQAIIKAIYLRVHLKIGSLKFKILWGFFENNKRCIIYMRDKKRLSFEGSKLALSGWSWLVNSCKLHLIKVFLEERPHAASKFDYVEQLSCAQRTSYTLIVIKTSQNSYNDPTNSLRSSKLNYDIA